MVRVAAVQLEPVIADVAANLRAADRLVRQAVREGAEWVLLPEFFTTGMGFVPSWPRAPFHPTGPPPQLPTRLARELGIRVGGSFLCADSHGEVHNAFVLVDQSGALGRRDKDIPTMWEDCYHIGGADDGVIDAGGITVGTALCLEYDRWPTVRRFQGRGDVVIGGSFIWGMPDLVTDDTTLQAFGNAVDWTPRFARLMGVPAVEAGVTGRLRCPMPGFPDGLRDDGPPGRSATIVDADGSVLAERHRDQGKGFAIADIEPRRPVPQQPPANPDAFWIAPLDPLTASRWEQQAELGRQCYAHGRGAPPRGRVAGHGSIPPRTPLAGKVHPTQGDDPIGRRRSC